MSRDGAPPGFGLTFSSKYMGMQIKHTTAI